MPDTKPAVAKGSNQNFPSGPILRTIEEFDEEKVESETVDQLVEARVVFANYELLQHDFPYLQDDKLEQTYPDLQNLVGRDKRLAIRSILDDWLKSNAAFISGRQINQTLVNSRIETTGQKITAFRPSNYGRAVVVPVKDLGGHSGNGTSKGLLDLKGIGTAPNAEPRNKSQSNGLLELGQALREVMFGEFFNAVFQYEGVPYRPIPIYGVLDLGFDIKFTTGERIPAGMMVRRVHRRPIYRWGIKQIGDPALAVEMELELLLRKYGITSVSSLTTVDIFSDNGAMVVKYGAHILSFRAAEVEWIRKRINFTGQKIRFEGMNFQFTREVNLDPPTPQIVDFGQFRVKKKLENPILSLVADHLVRLGEIIYPDDPRFVQPDERIRLPYEIWGTTGEIWGYKALDMGVPPAPILEALRTMDNPNEADSCVWCIDNLIVLGFCLAKEFNKGRITGDEVRKKLSEFVETATSRLC